MAQLIITCAPEDFNSRFNLELKNIGLNPTEINLFNLIKDSFVTTQFARFSKKDKENLADKLDTTYLYINTIFSRLVGRGILEMEGYNTYLFNRKMFPNKTTIVTPNGTILFYIQNEYINVSSF
jgi:hypothetical protein